MTILIKIYRYIFTNDLVLFFRFFDTFTYTNCYDNIQCYMLKCIDVFFLFIVHIWRLHYLFFCLCVLLFSFGKRRLNLL
jgi:hypothetical protein